MCADCAAGKYSTAGLANCINCAAGTYSEADGAPFCSMCSSGQYSTAGLVSCLNCDAGHVPLAVGVFRTGCVACGLGERAGETPPLLFK